MVPKNLDDEDQQHEIARRFIKKIKKRFNSEKFTKFCTIMKTIYEETASRESIITDFNVVFDKDKDLLPQFLLFSTAIQNYCLNEHPVNKKCHAMYNWMKLLMELENPNADLVKTLGQLFILFVKERFQGKHEMFSKFLALLKTYSLDEEKDSESLIAEMHIIFTGYDDLISGFGYFAKLDQERAKKKRIKNQEREQIGENPDCEIDDGNYSSGSDME